mgnify:CR=1 FL=1
MSKKDKAIQRLRSLPKDYTFSEARALMLCLGYKEDSKGSTSGSRVRFYKEGGPKINLHKPHPGDIMKIYSVKDLYDFLEEQGEI